MNYFIIGFVLALIQELGTTSRISVFYPGQFSLIDVLIVSVGAGLLAWIIGAFVLDRFLPASKVAGRKK